MCRAVLASWVVIGSGCYGSPDPGGSAECALDSVEERTRFESGSVPFDQDCRSEVQVRTCVDVRWSGWTGSLAHETCTTEDPRPCQAPPAEHGAEEVRTRYAEPEVAFGEVCQSEEQIRACWDGAWGAWSGTLEEESCAVAEPLGCTDPETEHGVTDHRVRFEAATVPFDGACHGEEQARLCWNGTWTGWSGTFVHEACNVAEPLPCEDPVGAHGATDSRHRYLAPSVPYGGTCQSEEQSRICHNGVWASWSGTFEHDDCVVPSLVSIRIVPGSPVLAGFMPFQFRAVAELDTGEEQEITELVSWASGDLLIVEFSGGPGVAMGQFPGTTSIHAVADGLEAEVEATVRFWFRDEIAQYAYRGVDFGGDQHGRMIVAWGDVGATFDADVVRARTWQQDWGPVWLVADEDDKVYDLRAAINQRGDRHVVWSLFDELSTFDILRASNWNFLADSASEVVTLTQVKRPGRPALALAHLGGALGTWIEGVSPVQRYASFDIDEGWPVDSESLPGRRWFGVDVDVVGNGILLLSDTWLSPTVGAGIYAAHYSRAADAVEQITTVYETSNTPGAPPYDTVSDAKIGMDYLGNAIVVWIHELGSETTLMASHYLADSGWQSPQPLLAAGGAQIILGHLSVHRSGTAAVAFSSNYGGQGHRIFAAAYAPDSGWELPAPMSSAGMNVTFLQDDESVTTAYDGRAAAVWSQPVPGGGEVLLVRRYDPDGGWGATEPVRFAPDYFSHASAFGLLEGFLVGYVVHDESGAVIESAIFR